LPFARHYDSIMTVVAAASGTLSVVAALRATVRDVDARCQSRASRLSRRDRHSYAGARAHR
jgi:hypothetical protein